MRKAGTIQTQRLDVLQYRRQQLLAEQHGMQRRSAEFARFLLPGADVSPIGETMLSRAQATVAAAEDDLRRARAERAQLEQQRGTLLAEKHAIEAGASAGQWGPETGARWAEIRDQMPLLDEALKTRIAAEDAANRVLQERRQQVQHVWQQAAATHLDARDALASLPRMDDEIAAAEREVARLKAERERRETAIAEGVVHEVQLVGSLNIEETIAQAMVLERRRAYDERQQRDLAGWAAAMRRRAEEGTPTLANVVGLYQSSQRSLEQLRDQLVQLRRGGH